MDFQNWLLEFEKCGQLPRATVFCRQSAPDDSFLRSACPRASGIPEFWDPRNLGSQNSGIPDARGMPSAENCRPGHFDGKQTVAWGNCPHFSNSNKQLSKSNNQFQTHKTPNPDETGLRWLKMKNKFSKNRCEKVDFAEEIQRCSPLFDENLTKRGSK